MGWRRWPTVMHMAVVIGLVALGPRAEADSVRLVPHGPERTLFQWTHSPCHAAIIPDAPARAFRRADGQITLLASQPDNWTLTGASLETLTTDCRPTLRSADYATQALGNMWIQAVYTHDGRHVVGLASESLTPFAKAAGCNPHGQPGRCWLNEIVAVQSDDMGQTFRPFPPSDRTVASLGRSYRPETTARFGYFTTSNIVAKDEFFYVFMFAQGEGVQAKGNCLFRTRDPFDPRSWRGWDGTDFTVAPQPQGDRVTACRPVAPRVLAHEVRSLTYIPRFRVWVAVFAHRLKLRGDKEPVPGFYLATSQDLLQWTLPSRIAAVPLRPRVDSPERFASYPSLIDPGSTSRTFDTLDSPHPVLLYTVQHLRNGQGTMNRDLNYIPLRIETGPE